MQLSRYRHRFIGVLEQQYQSVTLLLAKFKLSLARDDRRAFQICAQRDEEFMSFNPGGVNKPN
jgi:hypothetical protein